LFLPPAHQFFLQRQVAPVLPLLLHACWPRARSNILLRAALVHRFSWMGPTSLREAMMG